MLRCGEIGKPIAAIPTSLSCLGTCMEKDETRQDSKDMQVWDVLHVLLVEE